MINTSYIQPISNPQMQYNNAAVFYPPQGYENSHSQIKQPPLYNDSNLYHTSWQYANDLHGKMTKMERIYGIMRSLEKKSTSSVWNFFKDAKDSDIKKFKVGSGDIFIGANPKNNEVTSQFIKWVGFDAITPGNHEFDVPDPSNLAQLLKDTETPVLCANMTIKKGSPLEGKFVPSKIIDKGGLKVGVIGIAPSDIKDRVKYNDSLGDIEVK